MPKAPENWRSPRRFARHASSHRFMVPKLEVEALHELALSFGGQARGFGGQSQRFAPVLVRDFADMGAVVNPAELITQHGPQQLTVAVHFLLGIAVAHFDFLIAVQRLVPSGRAAVPASIEFRHIEPCAGPKVEEFARGRLIDHRVDVGANGNPFLEPDIATLEKKAEFLPVQAPGLREAVIHVHQNAVPIAQRAIDLVLQIGAGPEGALCGNHLAWSQPAIEQVKKMDTVLDENTAAFFAIPEPMFGRQALVAGIIFKIAMEKFS